MARIYVAEFADVAVTADQDLFSLLIGDDEPIKLLGCVISQNTDVGDAAAESLTIKIIRGLGTVGSGGSAPTGRNVDSKGGAATTTVRANDDTIATSGTAIDLHSECWNIAVPWIYMPIPELRFRFDQTDDITVVRLMANPADSITCSGTIYWEEL